MENDDCLCISFLISKLANNLCPTDSSALSRAVDIMQKSSNNGARNYNSNTFQFRWIMELEKQRKSEHITILRKNINFLSKSLKHPDSLFYILDESRQNSHQSELPQLFSIPNLMPIHETSLPSDFIPVLQGMDGIDFKWSIAQKRFIYRTSISPNLYLITTQVGMIGCIVKSLNNFLDSDQENGISHQNTSVVIRDMLHRHFLFVASIQQKFSTLTAQQLYSLLLSPEIELLKAATIICSNLTHKKGCDLYNTLNTLSLHGDKNISTVATQMKEKCFEHIDSLIRTWASHGRVSDPYSEFFIKCDESIRQCSKWWQEKFTFIPEEKIPQSLNKDLLQKIFNSGKILNFLRNWAEPVNLTIDDSLPLDQFIEISTRETNDLFMNLMYKENKLMQVINDIHDYVLLQRGDFANSLLEIDHSNITRRLTNLIEIFSNHVIREIDFKIKNNDWQLVYQAFDPLSAIFGKVELDIYKTASQVLLKIKRAEYALVHADKSTRQLSVVFYEMLHFVQIIENFINIHIIKTSYKGFLEVLENPKSFDDILEAHKKHTKNIAIGCWLTKTGSSSRNALYRILENLELAVTSPAALPANYRLFKELVQKFYDTIYNQRPIGKELARPLLAMFRFIEPKISTYV
ncbi:Spc97 [Tritrichomonas foetus]|uniref:Spc97 n=1 Tax=Tritrichomonas foetus TaxID=1144522 RepID=A0A1J4KYG0_9EUKA|nr:Spc97 [Tritrichomonas foetus]|eukprot:OHT16297.1 Spc97 [Tritrichomonas foetus]